MDKEKLIKSIMKDLECTREEAEEVAEMEVKAKGIKKYEKAEETKPRKPRERKVDETKKKILLGCKCFIEGLGGVVVSIKTETEVKFSFEGEEYTLKLTKHRPKKGE